MTGYEDDWITLDYLEIFCQRNQLVVGCRNDEEELWISPLGPHPSDLGAREVREILRQSSLFELREMTREGHEAYELTPLILTRSELQQRLRRLLN